MIKWFKRHEHKWIVYPVYYRDGLEIIKVCSVCGKKITILFQRWTENITDEDALVDYMVFAKGVKIQNPEYYVRGIDDINN